MKPPALVSPTQHFAAQRSDEGPVLVSVSALHLRHDVHTGVKTRQIMLPRCGLSYRSAKNVESRYLRLGAPFEMARPTAQMPMGIQRRADMAAVRAMLTFQN